MTVKVDGSRTVLEPEVAGTQTVLMPVVVATGGARMVVTDGTVTTDGTEPDEVDKT